MVEIDYDHEFWTSGDNDHQTLARRFEQGVEVTHPSGASCFCSDNCPWAATTVNYYDYTGPSIV